MQPAPLRHNRNFRLMCASAATTNLGDGVMAVAIPWLATVLTHDPVLIGLVAGARTLPWLLFALPAGVITDRFDHRRLLVSADGLRVVLTLALMSPNRSWNRRTARSWAPLPYGVSAGIGAMLTLYCIFRLRLER